MCWSNAGTMADKDVHKLPPHLDAARHVALQDPSLSNRIAFFRVAHKFLKEAECWWCRYQHLMVLILDLFQWIEVEEVKQMRDVMDAQITSCSACIEAYHNGRAVSEMDLSFYPSQNSSNYRECLDKLDDKRLLRSLEPLANPQVVDGPPSALWALHEILKYPKLLLRPQINQVLEHIVQNNKTFVFKDSNYSGLYLLLLHKQQHMRSWAMECLDSDSGSASTESSRLIAPIADIVEDVVTSGTLEDHPVLGQTRTSFFTGLSLLMKQQTRRSFEDVWMKRHGTLLESLIVNCIVDGCEDTAPCVERILELDPTIWNQLPITFRDAIHGTLAFVSPSNPSLPAYSKLLHALYQCLLELQGSSIVESKTDFNSYSRLVFDGFSDVLTHLPTSDPNFTVVAGHYLETVHLSYRQGCRNRDEIPSWSKLCAAILSVETDTNENIDALKQPALYLIRDVVVGASRQLVESGDCFPSQWENNATTLRLDLAACEPVFDLVGTHFHSFSIAAQEKIIKVLSSVSLYHIPRPAFYKTLGNSSSVPCREVLEQSRAMLDRMADLLRVCVSSFVASASRCLSPTSCFLCYVVPSTQLRSSLRNHLIEWQNYEQEGETPDNPQLDSFQALFSRGFQTDERKKALCLINHDVCLALTKQQSLTAGSWPWLMHALTHICSAEEIGEVEGVMLRGQLFAFVVTAWSKDWTHFPSSLTEQTIKRSLEAYKSLWPVIASDPFNTDIAAFARADEGTNSNRAMNVSSARALWLPFLLKWVDLVQLHDLWTVCVTNTIKDLVQSGLTLSDVEMEALRELLQKPNCPVALRTELQRIIPSFAPSFLDELPGFSSDTFQLQFNSLKRKPELDDEQKSKRSRGAIVDLTMEDGQLSAGPTKASSAMSTIPSHKFPSRVLPPSIVSQSRGVSKGRGHMMEGLAKKVKDAPIVEKEEDMDYMSILTRFGAQTKDAKMRSARPVVKMKCIQLPDSGRGRSIRPPPTAVTSTFPTLSSFHAEILQWDFQRLRSPALSQDRDLRNVPTAFDSPQEYLQVFEPLLLEEVYASIEQSKEDSIISVPATYLAVSSVDNFLVVKFKVDDARDSAPAHDDLVVVVKSQKKIQSQCEEWGKALSGATCYRLGRIEARKTGTEWERGVVEVKISARVGYGSDIRRHVATQNDSWSLIKVTNLATCNREFQALQRCQHLPLWPRIMHGRCDPTGKATSSPKLRELLSNLKERCNEEQYQAVERAVSFQEGFLLVQGPPGTGKTFTLSCILSALLQTSASSLQRTNSFNSSPTVRPKKKPILVCAPSNAAIDEILRRVLGSGLVDSSGSSFQPHVVRIGSGAHLDVSAVSLDVLVSSSATRTGEQSLEQSKITIRKKFSDVKAKIRHLTEELKGDGKGALKRVVELEDLKGLEKKLWKQLQQISQEQRDNNNMRSERKKESQISIIQNCDVVCCTLSSSGLDILSEVNVGFSSVVVDEAAQSVELSTLIPLRYKCKKCVLVGDAKQLPPTVISKVASRNGYSQSLFERLHSSESSRNLVFLRRQYRMHPAICLFPSEHFYDGQLLTEIAAVTKSYNTGNFAPFMFFHVDSAEQNSKGISISNPKEASAVVTLIKKLLTQHFANDMKELIRSVGVITPYRKQVLVIKEALASQLGKKAKPLDISTVDGFQGREKDTIIISCVRSNKERIVGFLNDQRRMNVGITRARHALFVLGNSTVLQRDKNWKAMIESAKSRDLYYNFKSWIGGGGRKNVT